MDRGQLRKLGEPTTLANGKRIPGLKLDHPRQLAVMHALVRFANIAAGSTFTTAEVYTPALEALGVKPSQYSLASFRYDLSKLRAKGLVEKLPRSRRYRLVGKGYGLPYLPKAVRAYLRPAHGRSSQAVRRRSETEDRTAMRTGPALSDHQ